MILFHGSKFNFSTFKSPVDTGNIRAGEEKRAVNLNVIFLTDNINKAIQYAREHAGDDGFIYEVEVQKKNLISLFESRFKQGKRKTKKNKNFDIFVASPKNIKIVDIWRQKKERRNIGVQIYQEN